MTRSDWLELLAVYDSLVDQCQLAQQQRQMLALALHEQRHYDECLRLEGYLAKRLDQLQAHLCQLREQLEHSPLD